MGRRAEVALYRIYATEKSHQYVRIVRSGRGWAPNTEALGKPGSFYLRYMKNGRRTFESVGDDLQVAFTGAEEPIAGPFIFAAPNHSRLTMGGAILARI